MDSNMSSTVHIPVLLEATLKALSVKPGGRYVDGTIGGGGHAAAIMENSSPGGQLLGIDADPKALEIANNRLKAYAGSIRLVNDNFANMEAICIKYNFFPVHGILLDLGLSSLQLNGSNRGFSFQHDAPLDMRLNPDQTVTAGDIVNAYTESKLADLIKTYGEDSHSRRIAHYIVQARPIKTTLHLAQTVERAIGRYRGRINPATKTFQALRIAVNCELGNLETVLKQAVNLLGFEGRLVVISYHSLEDRIVKQFMQRESRGCVCPPDIPTCVCQHTPGLKLINTKVITPSLAEIQQNRRSRSAKLRVAERIINHDIVSQAERHLFFWNEAANGLRERTAPNKLCGAFSAS